jgi:hypothetical protein
MNRNRRNHTRVPLPRQPDWTKTADFVLAPLTGYDANRVRSSHIGNRLDELNEVAQITVTAACTDKAVQYLANKGKTYVVFGFGNGRLGRGYTAEDFGTAGVVQTEEGYDYSAIYD